jgi:hypothetical protein
MYENNKVVSSVALSGVFSVLQVSVSLLHVGFGNWRDLSKLFYLGAKRWKPWKIPFVVYGWYAFIIIATILFT